MQNDVDHVWTITAAALVFVMQVGFLLLEAGSVRSKNSVNVAQKNLMDFLLSTVIYGAIGYCLMFGASQYGVFGWSPSFVALSHIGDWSLTFFVFQLMFCGTAATIMSGAVAERLSINGYLVVAVLIGALIYPVAGHWAWGGLLTGDEKPILAANGFMDFAGSTVVHGVGAWVALAMIMIIGPRIGKFDKDGTPHHLHGHSPVLATSGALLLFIGWIGFNGGSLLSGKGDFAPIIVNTIVAGGAGGVTLMLIGRWATGVFRPDATINGLLGGLVAITAGADVMTAQMSFIVGALGAVVVWASTWLLESVFKLDDPVGAIPVHGCAGAFGTIAIAFFAPAESLLAGSRLDQFLIQVTGVGLIFFWSFGVVYVVMRSLHEILKSGPEGGNGLRVTEEAEREGLNVHEHDAPLGTGILQGIMAEMAHDFKGGMKKINIDHGDEAYETSVIYNKIMDNLADERAEEERRYQEAKKRRMEVEAEIADVVKACVAGDYGQRLATEGREGFLLELCHGINGLCDGVQGAMGAIKNSLQGLSKGKLDQKITGEFRGELADIQNSVNQTLEHLDMMVADVGASVKAAQRGEFDQEISLEGKSGFFRSLSEGLNDLCAISEKGLTELCATLRKIGDGDLTADMTVDYGGKFSEISDAVTRMNSGLSQLMNRIHATAQEVGALGSEISNTSSGVAERSVEQASAIEGSVAVLEALNASVQDMADAARKSEIECGQAKTLSEEGRRKASDLSAQISKIVELSDNIMQTVEMVESLSSQTTLLSLNASVEAARGKEGDGSTAGFKVVAEEVRDLAKRSADAAQDIRERTQAVQDAVNVGQRLVKETDEGLSQIALCINDTTETVAALASAGEDQVARHQSIDKDIRGVLANARSNQDMSVTTSERCADLNQKAEETIQQLNHFTRQKQTDQLAA
ncbi:MAG: methyl-accepting chemotaxis protein [Mangrovicoccus sp.]